MKHNRVASYWEYAKTINGVDEKLKIIIGIERDRAENEDDDCVALIGGQPGSGKSNLAFWLQELWAEGNMNIKHVAFDRDQFPRMVRSAMQEHLVRDRLAHHDEANISKRSSMEQFNKLAIDLYEAIRGKRGFHLWCNPSINNMDKKFLEERIKFVIYCFKKPRGKYILIPRKKLLAMFDKYKNVKQETIEKHGYKYALYTGWFKKYPQNAFKIQYDELKDARQNFKLQQFEEKVSEREKYYSMRKAASLMQIGAPKLGEVLEEMKFKGLIKDEEYRTPTGHYRIPQEDVMTIADYIKKQREEKNG